MYSLFGVYDTLARITGSGIKTTVDIRGYAASAATVIAQGAAVRTMSENSRFLIHELSSWHVGTISVLRDDLAESDKLMEALVDIYMTRTTMDREEFVSIFERKDLWLSAKETKEIGLIDKIIKNKFPVEKK